MRLAADGMVDARPLALTRMGIGVAALLIGFETHAILDAISAPGTLRMPVVSWAPTLTPELADAIFAVWATLALALTWGFAARAAAAGLSALGAATLLLDQQTYSNHLLLLTLLTAFLALSRPSAAWSLDARRGKRAQRVAAWPVVLIQTQMIAVYAFAALSKVNGAFISGDVLSIFARETSGVSLATLGQPGLIGASLGAIGGEAFLALALSRKRLRPAAMTVGLLLHAGIVLMVLPTGPLFAFAVLCLSTYPLFLELPAEPRVVVWDDRCDFCAWSVAWLRRLDWFHAHEFVGLRDSRAFSGTGVTPEQADGSLQLVVGSRRLEGHDAIGRILELCPLTFLVAPVLRLHPIARVGRRVYRHVASRRTCTVALPVQAASAD